MALPNSINYSSIPDALKSDVNSTTMVINPVNSKSYYQPGEIIIFDYNSATRGFIDPKSIYLSYKVAVNGATATAGHILGCPVYSPFLRVDTIINSQTIESVNQWNMVCQYWVNTNLSVSDKAGIQAVYGYKDTDDNDRYMSMFDSRLLTANQNGTSVAVSDTDAANNRYFVSAPLICNILTSSEKLLPSFLMPQIRQQFTIDALANFVSSTTDVTLFYIYNIQLTYQLIDFGTEIQNMVMNIPKFLIKSNGWSNSATSISALTTGSQSIIFNQRYASIKSAVILSSTSSAHALNKTFDFCDITNGGTYQIMIGGICFPQLQLNASTNRAVFLQEIRKTQGNLYDTRNSMSINTIEFSRNETTIYTTDTDYQQPGKFIVAIDTTQLGCGSSKNLLNGISSQNSPISVLLNIATAIRSTCTINLVLNYDALLEIDPATSMVSVRV